MPVLSIALDAAGWRRPSDFYEALLGSLGAPDSHGQSIAALIDAMLYGGMNTIDTPYHIEVIGLAAAAEDARLELLEAFEALARNGADWIIRPNGDVRLSVA